MAAAYEMCGAEVRTVHLNEIFREQVSIHDFDILNLPGGFSFGDDLGSAKVLGNKIRFKNMEERRTLLNQIREFLEARKYIIGVCNGFQALVKMGLLPNIGGQFEQEATLTFNNSGKYEDRWVNMKVRAGNGSPFLNGIDTLESPVRHGEGKLLFRDEKIRQAVIAQNLNVLSYADANGNPTAEYPANPNGAELNCAGLTDPSRRVFGLMPHPEAFLSAYNHPAWAQRRRKNPGLPEAGDGLKIYRNIVEEIRNKMKEKPRRG
jgi:phosphoribosylformylglycinamidine synthase